MSQQTNEIYEFGSFRLDARERLLLREGGMIALTPKAFDLLVALVERHGRLVEKEELFQVVWPDAMVEESNLSSNIALIRKALGDGTNGDRYIETVPKRGYRFVAEVRAVQATAKDEASTNSSPLKAAASLSYPKRWRWVVLFAALGLLGSAAAWWVGGKRTPSVPAMRLTPFTSLPGTEFQPAFSPDGNYIAFRWRGENESNDHIYVKQIGEETVRQVTHGNGDDASPYWSPDGRFISFVRCAKDHCGFYSVAALGGAEHRLTPQRLYGSHFIHGSPDGKGWVVDGSEQENGTSSLYFVAAETGETRKLSAPPDGIMGDKCPAFSPDGKFMAFVRFVGMTDADLYRMPVAGGEPQRLTFNNAPTHQPVWTRDGREILFLSRSGAGCDHCLYRIPATGGQPMRVPEAGQRLSNIAVPPQGERLALAEYTGNSNLWQLEIASTASPRKLIASTRNNHSQQFSPDGKKVAFASNRTGRSHIWIADSDGQNLKQLVAGGSPRWSPDGKQIVYDSGAAGSADIYVIDVEGGQPRRLTMEESEDVVPSWSRDGNWIYFCSGRSGSLQIWKLPATGGQAVQVTQQGGFDSVEASDEQYLYYLKGRRVPGIWRVPVAGGEETLVTEHHRAGFWRYWAVAPQGIYFATAEEPDHPLLEFYPFATGKITTITTLNKRLHDTLPGLAVSQDGRWLLWSQLDEVGSDIMLLENFR